MKLIKISLSLSLLYAISLLIAYSGISDYPMTFTGLILILFIIPLNILNIFDVKIHSLLEHYILSIALFFFVYVPIYYSANHFLHIRINAVNLSLFNLLLLITSWLISIKRKKDIFTQFLKHNIKLNKNEKLLILFIIIFFVSHGINFYFYKFIPEWDGYTNIVNLEKILKSGLLINNYRPLYFTATSVLSSFTNLSPYNLYQTVMIGLQVNLIIVLYLFINEFKITNNWSKIIIYLSALSIPVLNMEIDMTRPQNTLIIMLPIYFYLLFNAIKTNKKIYWVLTSLIALLGYGFHEFFIFTFTIHIVWIFILLFKKYFLAANNKQNKKIFFLISLICILILKDIFSSLRIYSSLIYYSSMAVSRISNISAWKLWFINSYNSDGDTLQMGWSGLSGLVKYYSYYLSPVLVVTLIILLWLMVKKNKIITNFTIDDRLIFFITIPPLIMYFILTEILPRINFTLLPDRYWFMFDIVLLLLMVEVIKIIEKVYKVNYDKYLILFVVMIVISMGGSFYIAREKKALTTKDDYISSQWILNNTPQNAIFITQAANTPMIYYFAKRKTMNVDSRYFMDDNLETNYLENKIKKNESQIENENKLIQDALINIKNKNENYDSLISIIKDSVGNKNRLADEIQSLNEYDKAPLYILYSENKFSTIYNQRIWWKNVNYYGAKIEKFNYYPLVYNSRGVYIWKLK